MANTQVSKFFNDYWLMMFHVGDFIEWKENKTIYTGIIETLWTCDRRGSYCPPCRTMAYFGIRIRIGSPLVTICMDNRFTPLKITSSEISEIINKVVVV